MVGVILVWVEYRWTVVFAEREPIAIRVPGQLVAIKVSQERPHRVHESGFVGWVGNVIAQREPDVPFLHCEGEGAVFVMLPRGNSESKAAE